MFVAIIDQTNPVGVVPVKQFQVAANEAAAVAAYVNSFNPPLDPADWLGFDTGWAQFQPPGYSRQWAYDFNTQSLVEKIISPTQFELKGLVQVVNGEITLSEVDFVELGGTVAAPQLLAPNLEQVVLRVIGLYRATDSGSQLRLEQNGVPLTPDVPLLNSGGVWVPFVFNTTIAPGEGLNTYTVTGRPGLTSTTAVKFVSLLLLQVND